MSRIYSAFGNIFGFGPLDSIHFADPHFLIIIPLLLIFAYYYYLKRQYPSLLISNLDGLEQLPISFREYFGYFAEFLKVSALILMIIALSRPQGLLGEAEVLTEGTDIMLVLDVSTSMLAEDFRPKNRLIVAKDAIKSFIESRENDRIGLVIFSGESFTQCPLTLDYGLLLDLVDNASAGMIKDGTAIGMGLATAINRLRESPAKSKTIILLTDGRNNMGEIDPETASGIAKALGIKVYTIGAGKRGPAPYPIDDPIFGKRYVTIEEDLDENMLERMAQETGGRYYRADDEKKAREIYKEISDLEKSKVETKMYYSREEMFHIPLLGGLFLLALGALSNMTIGRSLP